MYSIYIYNVNVFFFLDSKNYKNKKYRKKKEQKPKKIMKRFHMKSIRQISISFIQFNNKIRNLNIDLNEQITKP